MITCKCCGKEKDNSMFYKHPNSATGFDSSCKECRKEKVRQNRINKAEYYREYDKKRFKNDPRVKERHARYMSTERGKQKAKEARIRFQNRNPVKRAAHVILGNAVRSGNVKKPSACEDCGSTGKIHGHHDDYSKPLDVRWLCPACHRKWHNENGEGKKRRMK